jgi:hypothetical protein
LLLLVLIHQKHLSKLKENADFHAGSRVAAPDNKSAEMLYNHESLNCVTKKTGSADMKSYSISMEINAKAEDVLKLVTTVDYVEKEALVDGAVSSKTRIERSDSKSAVIVSDRVEYSRGPNGKITKNKTEKNVLTSEWSLDKMRSSWKVKVPGMEMLVNISGETWIEPAGDKCRLCDKGNVSVKVPFIGGAVENAITEDIKKNFPLKKPLIEKELGINA